MSDPEFIVKSGDTLVVSTQSPISITLITVTNTTSSKPLTATAKGNEIRITLEGTSLLHNDKKALCIKPDIETIQVKALYTNGNFSKPGTLNIPISNPSGANRSALSKLKNADKFVIAKNKYSNIVVTPESQAIDTTNSATDPNPYTFEAAFELNSAPASMKFA